MSLISSLHQRIVKRARGERGAAMVMTAGLMVALTAFMGLGIDAGMLFHHRRVMQTAADAGALAGANEVYRGQISRITSSALSETAANEYVDATAGIVINVFNPPTTGAFVGDNAAVEVLIAQPSPSYFMRVLGWTSVGVSTRAVGWAGANDRNCIYVMEETEQDSFSYNSSAQLDAECGLRVNSGDSWGTHLTSSANVSVESASITGDYVEESSSVLDAASGVQTDVWPRAPDPLGYLVEPVGGACNFVDLELDQPSATLWPGVYCGKLTLKNNTHATMMPGMYIIRGGALKTESNSILDGDGVTIFLTEGGGYDFEPLSFQSSSVIDLSAPTTGPYAGILFWGDDDAGSEDDMHRFESSSVHRLEGALYFPRHILSIESSSVISAAYTVVVARELWGDSNSILDMNADYSSLPGGSPLKRVALVE